MTPRIVLHLLEKRGIEVNAAEMWGSTALIWAAKNGHERVAQETKWPIGEKTNSRPSM